MVTNRIKYSNEFIKCFKPYDFHASNKTKRKHHGGWQRALKRTPLYRTTIPVIVSSNCRSLPNKIMHLQSLLSSDTYHNTAIVTLQETWLHDLYDDNLVSLNGFTLFRQDRICSRKKRGGGVATFIHSQWSTSNNVCFSFSSDFIDCITVKCRPKHLSKFKYVFISNIYVTPGCSASDLSHFADEFTAFAVTHLENSLSVVTGDFNTCDCSFLESLGHVNIVKFPTRLDKTLDLVFTNDAEIYEARRRAPIMNSDHCIIRILPKIYSRYHSNILSNLSRKTQQRCYSQENVLKLRCMLSDTNWELFTEHTLDDTISNLTDYLKFCLDVCCPKQILFKRIDRFSSPHLKKLRREKERLYKAKDKAGLRRINIQIKSEIKRLNNIYNQRILSCKTPGNMWKLFKEITGCGKHSSCSPSIDVNTLNRSFIRLPNVPSSFNVTNNMTSDFNSFKTSDVLKCLKSLKPSQSLGPD
ncbi:unnamed protein product, partial [Trichobilharzia szidati]